MKSGLEGDFVYAPYISLLKNGSLEIATEIVVITEEVLEELPPSDGNSIQVGGGDGPAVLTPRRVEIRPKVPGIMSRYGMKMANQDLYKSILISTT